LKRILFAFLLILLPISPAQSSTLITLTAPTNKLADGRFINNELAISISPGGNLGKALEITPSNSRTWLIDPALIEEITDLVDGYIYLDQEGKDVEVAPFDLANTWLIKLRFLISNNRVVAITYGAPSQAFLERIAPGELLNYNSLSKLRLEAFLNREVIAPGKSSIAGEPALIAKNAYTALRKSIKINNSVITSKDVEDLRLGLAKTLNPALSKDDALLISKSYSAAIKGVNNKLRISPGNYTITTKNYDLPVTIINDFTQPVSLDLVITTTNSRVLVDDVPRITIDGQSQIQIEVPIEVIASGDTALRLQLYTPKADLIGLEERIPLRLAIISPITTWLTTGMAIILLLAAIVQSVRRVKSRRGK
jgi:hypothetical protein